MTVAMILILASITFVCIHSSSALINIKLNDDKSILYLYHQEQCSWLGVKGTNCIKTFLPKGEHVMILNADFNYFIKSMVTGPTWIGAMRYAAINSNFNWINGQWLDYQNWASGEPDRLPLYDKDWLKFEDYCVDIDEDGEWRDAPCSDKRNTLLQFKVTPNLGRQLYDNITTFISKTPFQDQLSEDAIQTLREIDDSLEGVTEASGELTDKEIEHLNTILKNQNLHVTYDLKNDSIHDMINDLIKYTNSSAFDDTDGEMMNILEAFKTQRAIVDKQFNDLKRSIQEMDTSIINIAEKLDTKMPSNDGSKPMAKVGGDMAMARVSEISERTEDMRMHMNAIAKSLKGLNFDRNGDYNL